MSWNNKGIMLATNEHTVANRRAQLKRWIDTHFGGSQTMFIASTNDGEKQINQGELSALLKNKSFGERRARSLEKQARMPAGYLDQVDQVTTYSTVQENGHAALPPPPKPTGWPFVRVSLERIMKLKRGLGNHRGAEAITDIDETLELAVTKWERRLQSQQKTAA